ncbi:RING/U-box superfamily protein, partial [Striga asiatica]
MAFPIPGLHRKTQTNKLPSLMEARNENEHVIDIASSSSSNNHHSPSVSSNERLPGGEPSTSSRNPVYQTSRNSSLARRANSRGRQRSPLNSAVWISVELVLTVSQIIAAVVVLSLSEHESPRAPLRAWIVGYASGCFAILPLLYWRFKHRNQVLEQDGAQRVDSSSQGLNGNNGGLLTRRVMEGEERRANGAVIRGNQSNGLLNSRLKVFVEYFKMALDCFFAVWFVVGNVWIFGGHSSSSEAPNLYRLCIVFLAISCIGYAMPFILCTTICCCLPCIISVLGFREDFAHNRGATQESINSLPTYKFKIKKSRSSNDKETGGGVEGGIVAAGTEKERVISGEDA